MIDFKRFDWIFQLILLVGSILFFLVNQNRFMDFEFILSYFVIGGWQLISILVHMFYPSTVKHKLRTIHGILTVLLFITTGILIGVGEDLLIEFLVGVLFVTPALAILYLITCYLETKKVLVSIKNSKTFNLPKS